MDPYAILGVSKSASESDIKNAYRKLAKKLHPDLNPGNKDAEKQFKEVNQAYEFIGTKEAREKFDRGETATSGQSDSGATSQGAGRRYYRETQSGPGFEGRYTQNFGQNYGNNRGMDEDLFESIFGQMGGMGGQRGAHAGPSTGEDELYQMEIDFKDSILGATREITLPNGKKLRITIPPGIETGKKLRFAGQGGPGVQGGPSGDLYIQMQVRPSPTFKRVGNHLELEMPISIAEAILGGEIKVPTLDGSILLNVPAGVSSGQKLRAAGKGVPAHGSEPVGDLYVVLKLVTPKEIDPELKAAVEAWKKRHPEAGA